MDPTPYIGLPYADGGRGPEAFDCWGLVRHVLAREFGVELPRYEYGGVESRRDLIDSLAEDYRPAAPQAGAIALCHLPGRRPHVGVCVDAVTVLHTREATGAVLERIDSHLMRNAIRGFYLPNPRS